MDIISIIITIFGVIITIFNINRLTLKKGFNFFINLFNKKNRINKISRNNTKVLVALTDMAVPGKIKKGQVVTSKTQLQKVIDMGSPNRLEEKTIAEIEDAILKEDIINLPPFLKINEVDIFIQKRRNKKLPEISKEEAKSMIKCYRKDYIC